MQIGQMTLDEVITEWKRQRGEHYLFLHNGGMTYEAIAKRYKVTRQYVGQLIKALG